MRAGIVTGKQQFELLEFPDPAPAPGEAVVAISLCGICGSDVHAYQEGWPYSPGLCGHEWVGSVVGVGAGVNLVAEGERVAGAQAPGCGNCRECRAGLPEYCALSRSQYSGPAAPKSGGFAPFLTLAANRLIPIPPNVDDQQAALIEPAAVALHAVKRSRFAIGDIVSVAGCGPIGLMTIQCLRLAGAGRIIAAEPDATRRAQALELGADLAVAPGPELREVINAETQGLRCDIAFDCAGIPQTLQQCVDMVRFGGSVCMVGVSGDTASIQPMRWMMKEVSVDTSIIFSLAEMSIAANLIGDGRIRTRELVADVIDLDALPSTIDALAKRTREAIKILVDPSAG